MSIDIDSRIKGAVLSCSDNRARVRFLSMTLSIWNSFSSVHGIGTISSFQPLTKWYKMVWSAWYRRIRLTTCPIDKKPGKNRGSSITFKGNSLWKKYWIMCDHFFPKILIYHITQSRTFSWNMKYQYKIIFYEFSTISILIRREYMIFEFDIIYSYKMLVNILIIN